MDIENLGEIQMGINVVGHNILIETDEVNLTTDWGFDLTSSTDQRLENAANIIGTLVSVGSQAWKAYGFNFSGEPWAKEGDRVMFKKYSGDIVEDPETGKSFLLMQDGDIKAVITGEENV